MSGSPVYLDGSLVGAVALGFCDVERAPSPESGPLRRCCASSRNQSRRSPPRLREPGYVNGDMRLEEIATPVSFSGFTAAALDHFAPQLRALGLDPRQGVSGGGNPAQDMGDPRKLEPGSMISVQLLTGDMSVSADGTITAIDGNRLYAFGHRFMATGSDGYAVRQSGCSGASAQPVPVPSRSRRRRNGWAPSPRIAIRRSPESPDAGVSGAAGHSRRAEQLPHEREFRIAVMTPLVAQMAVFSAMDSTERSVGAATYSVRGHMRFRRRLRETR